MNLLNLSYRYHFLKWFGIASIAFALWSCGSAKKHITIGTGGITGVYYPVGGAISKLVNEKSKSHLKATYESTGGSVFNVNARFEWRPGLWDCSIR